MGALDKAIGRMPLFRQMPGLPPSFHLPKQYQASTPEIPPALTVHLERHPGQQCIRLTYPDGQSELLFHSPDIARKLIDRGIPQEKVEKALDYIWNYRHLLVKCRRNPGPPKAQLPEYVGVQ
jgi:hypothetical protein